MGQMIDEKHEDHMSGSGADSETLSHSDDLHTRNNGTKLLCLGRLRFYYGSIVSLLVCFHEVMLVTVLLTSST